MYLKTLDIHGFKSFPDKLKLEFNKGITAVVGPNGSGKSNISDAVRWVLGEQSSKSLRGSKMEDIIFNGTSNRKPLNFAQVSITLDNSDNSINLEFPEITITRRIYRSGESNYFINNVACRLKDIYELLSDTGIGKDGYSIISQGKIDEILSAKSEDRRNMFEEATGILKLKNRCEEAKVKLNKEKQNLDRINDIILTLASQIEPLKTQSVKAKEFLELREKLKLLEINLFLNEIESLDKNIAEFEFKLNEMSSSLNNYRTTENDLKVKQLDLKHNNEQISNTLNEAQEEYYSLNSEIEKNEANIELLNEQINHIVKDAKKIDNEIKKNSNRIKNLDEDELEHNLKYNSIIKELDIQTKLLDEAQIEFNKLNSTLEKNERLIENYNTQIVKQIKKSSQLQNDIERDKNNYVQLIKHRDEIYTQKINNKSQLEDQNLLIGIITKSKAENIEIEAKILNIIKSTIQLKNKTLEKLKASKKELDNLNSLLNQLESNYKYLKSTQKEHRGFSESVKNILKAKEENPAKWNNVHGVIGEIISVSKKFEYAVEIALGSNINNIITSTEDEAKICIDYLKQIKGGRASFLPLSSIKPKRFNFENLNISSEVGFIGIASDLIKYNQIYDDIIKSLLGRVIIVDNLNNAILISKKSSYSLRIVTLDGDLINPGGVLSGGSKSLNTNNILGKSREIKETENKISDIKSQISNLKLQIDSLEEDIEDYNDLIENKQEEYQNNHAQIKDLENQATQALNFIADIKAKQNHITEEETELLKKIEASKKSISLSENFLSDIDNENQKLESKLADFQNNIKADKVKKETFLNNITNIKVKISALNQEKLGLEENIKRLKNEIDLTKDEINSIKAEIQNLQLSKLQKNDNILKLKAIINELVIKKENQIKNIKCIELEKKNNLGKLENVEHEIEGISKVILQSEKEIVKFENQINRLFETRKSINQNMVDEYDLTLEEASKYKNSKYSESYLKRDIKQLRLDIKNLGNINLESISEYERVNKEFEFLNSQKNDIVETEKQLKLIIEELTNSMISQFTEQFKLISNNFNDVFREIFGGGEAYLQLTDETNVLESGIEIIAKPPGKNLQNMMLLSGGERALTAIAILFAILKLKPSPFCILDEIEAALDDANVNRYAGYLKSFSNVTQFIVVTHRKGTMEAADTLYGITMQEQGVSKLVSIKFEGEKLT